MSAEDLRVRALKDRIIAHLQGEYPANAVMLSSGNSGALAMVGTTLIRARGDTEMEALQALADEVGVPKDGGAK